MRDLETLHVNSLKFYNVFIFNIVLFLLFSLQAKAQGPAANPNPGDICFVEVDGEYFNWYFGNNNSSSSVSTPFIQPGTDYGFTIDIFTLDNSFNMIINGVELATNEIEFQSNSTPGINIEFQDGDQYEVNTQAIWQYTGNAANPLIRVVIDPNGQATIYGSKGTNGPLFPLKPKTGVGNSFVFNTVPWNPTSSNSIVVTQNVVGVTSMEGRGYGRNIVPNP